MHVEPVQAEGACFYVYSNRFKAALNGMNRQHKHIESWHQTDGKAEAFIPSHGGNRRTQLLPMLKRAPGAPQADEAAVMTVGQ